MPRLGRAGLIQQEVRKSGRKCDYDTILDWVADHRLTTWDVINVDDIPDPRAVDLLVLAKKDQQEFYNIYKTRRNKDAMADIAEAGERKARKKDERDTATLIAEFERALDAAEEEQ